MRTLIIGDIHGRYEQMIQALERANYDPTEDILVQLGDLTDSYIQPSNPVAVLDFFCNTEAKIMIRGNHDVWLMEWITQGILNYDWLSQGGEETLQRFIDSYPKRKDPTLGKFLNATDDYSKLLRNQYNYYLDGEENKQIVYVHAGWLYPQEPINSTRNKMTPEQYWWDRTLWEFAGRVEHEGTKKYDKIFIGHTSVYNRANNPSALPLKKGNIWNLDTGAGGYGKVTVMDRDTEEYWQSDKLDQL